MISLLEGDVRAMLATIEPESVQCCVTSPPYWGLRSYGTEPLVWGGDPEHVHEVEIEWIRPQTSMNGQGASTLAVKIPGGQGLVQLHAETKRPIRAGQCACGAWLGSLGLEPTPELFVEHLVEVFRGVRRVLRKDGVLFLNLGDSYAGSGKGPSNSLNKANGHSHVAAETMKRNTAQFANGQAPTSWISTPKGLKPKDLVGMPWRVALALQADGWWWRSTIVWAKKSCMPESVTDRPTNAWEPILLFAKSRTYFWDADAVREEATYAGKVVSLGEKSLSRGLAAGAGITPSGNGTADSVVVADGRNQRNVWDLRGEPASDFWLLGPEPFPGAHFATFPTEIPRRCILAGSRLGDTVLDPFAGSGTTGLVADRLGRHSVLIELNPDYARMARERLIGDAPMFVEVAD